MVRHKWHLIWALLYRRVLIAFEFTYKGKKTFSLANYGHYCLWKAIIRLRNTII